MIKINDKQQCCGCSSCVQVCPKQCIKFKEDADGFRYPIIDNELCIDCGLCERVCPCINQDEYRIPIKVYAGVNPDEKIRLQSSSGGVFTSIAEAILQKDGVVFGAKFNDKFEVVHSYVESIDSLNEFRGSKYVQSIIGTSYYDAKCFLEEGRFVLFTGTPCQIAGLRKFLRKQYDNLLCVDVVCHGVPSPLVWKEYLNYILSKEGVDCDKFDIPSKEIGISFRDKNRTGWKNYGFSIRIHKSNSVKCFIHETLKENLYLEIFQHNLGLRPSCYLCPAKKGESGSDITIADFWRICDYYPELDDDKGISLIMCYTQKGIEFIKSLNINLTETTYQNALLGNRSIEKSALPTRYDAEFWPAFHEKGMIGCKKLIDKYYPSLTRRIMSRLVRLIQR